MRKVNKVVAAAIAASMMVLSVSGLFTANEISKDEIMPSSELVQEESTEHMQVSGNTLEPEEQETTDEALNYEETSQSDEAIAYDEELTIEPRNTDVPPDFVSVKERNWDIIGEEDPGYGNYVSFMEEAFFNGYMNIDGVNTSTGNNIIIWGSPTNSDGIHTTVGDCVPGYTFEDYEGYYFTSNGNGYYRCPSTNIKKVGVDKSKWVMQKNCFIIMHKPESLDENGCSKMYKYIQNAVSGSIKRIGLDFDYSKVSGNGNFGTAYVVTTYDKYAEYVPESRDEQFNDYEEIKKYTTWHFYDNWDIEEIKNESNFLNSGYKTSKIVFVKDNRIIKIIPGCKSNTYDDDYAWIAKDEKLYWQEGIDYDYALRVNDEWMMAGDEVFLKNHLMSLYLDSAY